MFDAQHLIDLLIMGWLSNVPLAIGSIWTLSIFGDRWWKLRGLEDKSRALASQVIEQLASNDPASAKRLCEESNLAIADMLLEGLRWENVAVEDLDRVFATIRAELGVGLKRGIWIIGTVGSLAPFVGLFGTVVGIIRAFATMAESGETGFNVVANSLSEALIATAAGLGVAIIALLIFNYLNTRVASVNQVYARASERLVQALLYVESRASGGRRLAMAISALPGEDSEDGGIVAEINITPLTDIFLVLLIIFMVTTTVAEEEGKNIDLPEATESSETPPKSVTVAIDGEGVIKINDKVVQAGMLEQMMEDALAVAEEKVVILKGDKVVMLGQAVNILDIAQQKGAKGISIATQQPDPGS